MENLKTEVKGNKLVIEVDCSKNEGPSRTGKSTIIASTHGALPVSVGDRVVYLNLNVYEKRS